MGAPTIAASSLLFALMAVLARYTSGQAAAGQLAFARMATGFFVVLALFGVLKRRPSFLRPWLLLLRGLLGGISVALYFYAIEHVEVGPATLFNNTAPGYATLFAGVFLGERVRARTIGGLIIAMCGAALVIASTLEPGRGLHLGLGAAAGLLSGAISGGAMTTIRALRSDTDTFTVLFSFCVVGSAVTLPIALLSPMPAPSTWPLIFVVGILSVGAQLLLTHAFKFVSVIVGGVTTQLTTVFSWTLGVVFLGEKITVLAAAGALLCAIGVTIASGLATSGRARPELAIDSPR
jgi:drug/metabolite transporter (DMT)-like permease